MSTPNQTIKPKSKTDVQYQEIKLFIEGIQVPFLSISINTALGQFPQATISMPPQVGLMELTRFYNPKVHIFFLDPVDGVEKVLFSGLALSPTSNRTAEGTSSITFTCVHRNHLMTDLLIDFSTWTEHPENVRAGNDGAYKATGISSKYAVGTALTGIMDASFLAGKVEVTDANVQADRLNGTTNVSTAFLPTFLNDYKNRIIGMPSVLVNLWNQIKQGTFLVKEENDEMTKLYIPLMEEGLQFFQRMAGHYYLEGLIDGDRITACTTDATPEASNKPRLVPPCSRVFLRSSAQSTFAEEQVYSVIEYSGELVDLFSLYSKFLASLDYEMLFLTCPAEIPKDTSLDQAGNFKGDATKTYGVDTIIKPELPFYFSPVCNILYPSMIRNVNVTQDDYNIPTRLVFTNRMPLLNSDIPNQYFRSPHTIRQAIASYSPTSPRTVIQGAPIQATQPGTTQLTTIGTQPGTIANVSIGNLASTLNNSHGKIGKFEFGRGIRAEKADMPPWLKFLAKSQDVGGIGQKEIMSDADLAAANALRDGWRRRYGIENDPLNPYDNSSGLMAHQRILVLSADYYYAKSIARSRAGSVDCIFNPYIVPGYPMDILDSTPNHPSFHAYCTSVTHTITPNSINTTIGFVSAMTYTELANYYMMPVHPWLMYSLGLAQSQSIVDYYATSDLSVPATSLDFGEDDPLNPTAANIADRFYKTTLGVGAAKPTMLYDFDNGLTKPVDRQNFGLIPGVVGPSSSIGGGELNPNLSGIGNLALNYRNIESRDSVEQRWNVKFVDLKPGNYNPNAIKINSKVLADKDKLELGQSIWLDYDT